MAIASYRSALDPVVADRALAFQDDLVEVGLGGEPVPAALQPHVPEGGFERVPHVLDQPARQPGAPDAEQHLGGGGAQHPVRAERVQERRRRQAGGQGEFFHLAAAPLVFRRARSTQGG